MIASLAALAILGVGLVLVGLGMVSDFRQGLTKSVQHNESMVPRWLPRPRPRSFEDRMIVYRLGGLFVVFLGLVVIGGVIAALF